MDSSHSPKRPPPPPPPEDDYHTDHRGPTRLYHKGDRPYRSHHPYAPNYSSSFPRENSGYSRDAGYHRDAGSYSRELGQHRESREALPRGHQASFREGGYSRDPPSYGRDASAYYGRDSAAYSRDSADGGVSRDGGNYGRDSGAREPRMEGREGTNNGEGGGETFGGYRSFARGPSAGVAQGRRSTSPRRTGPTEFRMSIDTSAFPVEMNAIAQILGPRGKHQQRMKGEADAIVTLVGKGVRGHGPDEPLCLVIKSRSNSQPLTKRQIAAVQAIYDHILLHARQFKTTDNMSGAVAIPNTGPPETYVEALWYLHQLLIVPRAFDLEVGEIFHAYKEHYGYNCPLDKWLAVNLGEISSHTLPVSAALALQRALEKLPHVVDLYRQGEEGPWRVRAANAPDILFATFRELDEVYRMKMAELSSKGENEKIKTYTAVLQAVYRLLLERCVDMNGSLALQDLVGEYQQIYRQELDVYEAFQEPSLLRFIQRFPSLFSVFYDGQHWRAAPVLAASAAVDSTVERAVHQFLVMPRKPRVHIRLASIVPLPPKLGGPVSVTSGQTSASNGGGSSAVSNLVALLQSARAAPPTATSGGFTVVGVAKPQPAEAATVGPAPGPSVTAQIQELLKKKKEQSAAGATGGPLDGLLNALKKK